MKRWLKIYLTSTRAPRNLWGRLRLRNRTLTVISNDCWGGMMLKYHNLPFNTPFVGLFVYGPDYIEMLEHPETLKLPLTFIAKEQSRWYKELMTERKTDYPIGVLGDTGLEIHFLHYATAEEARQKWTRRVARINWDNAIVKFSDRYLCSEELVRRFDRLPYRTKVCFLPRALPYASVCALPEFRGEERVSLCWYLSNWHWSFVKHANALL